MRNISFIDESTINIKSGDGGNGASVFHKEKYISRGGPSGGNGGNGGNIFFKATRNKNTLLDFRNQKIWKADAGVNGGKTNMTGANGKNLIIEVPVGTEVNLDGRKVADLIFEDQLWLAELGGKGGRGNKSFKSSKNIAPDMVENGEVTEVLKYELNLKLLADVGLLGFPNAGKSTFISVISNSRPKIADYEFTTLRPSLGVANYQGREFVVTDLPGLIEGASENKGEGIQFLKHLARTRVMLHMLDSSNDDAFNRYNILRNEIEKYSPELYKLPEIIVFTKLDLLLPKNKEILEKSFKGKTTFFISSLTNEGIDEIKKAIVEFLDHLPDEEELEDEYKLITLDKRDDELKVENINDTWIVDSNYCRYWANRIPLTSSENLNRILMKFKSQGIIKKLENLGLKFGDIITVKKTPFTVEYYEKELVANNLE